MRTDQFDSALPQAFPLRIAVVGFVGNRQVGFLVPWGSSTLGDPQSEMEGKLVTATGTLSRGL